MKSNENWLSQNSKKLCKLVWTNLAYSFPSLCYIRCQGFPRSSAREARTTLDIRTTNTRSCNMGRQPLAKHWAMALKLQPWSPYPILLKRWEQFLTWMPMIWERSTHFTNAVTLHPVSYVVQKTVSLHTSACLRYLYHEATRSVFTPAPLPPAWMRS